MFSMNPILIVLALLVIAILLGFIPLGNIISGTITAPCQTDSTQTTCSVSNYQGLSSQVQDISIEGVRVNGLYAYLENKNVAYSRCKYQCTGTGYGGTSFNTGWIEGNIGEDGCFGNTGTITTGYHGGNAFSTSCNVVLYNEAVELPDINCNNDGSCNNGEDITCIDCQGEQTIVGADDVLDVISDYEQQYDESEPVYYQHNLLDSIINSIVGFFNSILRIFQ